MKRIAVFGAGGFLGSHLVPCLVERFGCDVDAVDVDLRKLEYRGARAHRITARVEQPGLADEIVARADVVISLTALCNPALYNSIPLEVIDGNFTHLVPLVNACAARRVRLIHFSTCEVYGRRALDASGEPMLEMNEDDSGLFLGPVGRERWTYACAKQLLERLLWAHGRHGGLPFTIVRVFNVIGPRMDFVPGVDGEGVPRVLASFMGALLRGEALPLVDGGRSRRSFMAVSDLSEAVARIVSRPDACRGQILNLGNPRNDVSIFELGRLLAEVFEQRVPRARKPRFRSVSAAELYGEGYDDVSARIPDIAKAQRLLDWTPALSLAQVLPSIVDDYVRRYGAALAPDLPDRADEPSVLP